MGGFWSESFIAEAYPINRGFATLPAGQGPNGAVDWSDSAQSEPSFSPQGAEYPVKFFNENKYPTLRSWWLHGDFVRNA
jgi:hypothetical protein